LRHEEGRDQLIEQSEGRDTILPEASDLLIHGFTPFGSIISEAHRLRTELRFIEGSIIGLLKVAPRTGREWRGVAAVWPLRSILAKQLVG
jgi:hypothetical protein